MACPLAFPWPRATRAPGAAFDFHVDDIEQMRRQPQGDDLSDPHHHVPADDLGAFGRKPFPPPGGGEMSLDSLQIFRLVVLEEDRQEDRLGRVAAHAIASKSTPTG